MRNLAYVRPLPPKRDICSLKNTFGSPGRPLAQKALGEPLHISPGRGKLAWARLSVSAIVRTCTTHTHTPNRGSSQSRHS
ncbi:hypothetical protein DEO72_LG5g818 [Vigna unguiculata]|uniref:Uncharacterized protein n=1 Tax=Vigna unguiculata TaxID=3917 RepID=A0A4D6LUM0_VIGUN|nr:hypothetical protein DEO72_LG5g818 [Vigna unguiculata]